MNILEKQSGENARSYALRVLLNNIISLELPPGSPISENELAATLNLSRTPIREALIELSKMQLVEILPQRGSYISKIDYNVIEDSKFVRLVLENAVIKLACKGISEEYITILRENLAFEKICVNNSDHTKFFELDIQFHQLIFKSVGKERVHNIIQSQMVHFDRLRSLSLKSISYEKLFKDHEDILYAIERKDGEMGELLITRHLERHNVERSQLIELYPEYFLNP
ncbi:MAG: GntR family transcriptional regulator [Lachnospiraceae bacterium]